MQRLGMPISDDTILRQLKRDAADAQSNSEVRAVGIDDWSWRRATSYGTIMVDLERRSVVDILHDRSVESAAKWLQNHPSIEVVSRDRCGLYAQAVREGAPQAQQVADRFHLVQNLRLAIEEQMSLSGRATGRSILSEDAIVTLPHIVGVLVSRIANLVRRYSTCSTLCARKGCPTARSPDGPAMNVAA
jgi:transposase